jgi:AcrR family transcriptional regulator
MADSVGHMTKTPRLPGPRERNPRGEGDRLRDEIVAAAAEVVTESGDTNTLTLRGVARRIGIAAPSIYRHFRDVEQLKMAVVERSFAKFAEARDGASETLTDRAAALLAGCQAYCQFAVSNPGPYRFLFSHQAPRRVAAGIAAFERLVTSIRRCQETGVAGARDDPTRLAAEVWAALHGLALLRINAPQFPWPASLEDMADQSVARLVVLHGEPNSPSPQRRNG